METDFRRQNLTSIWRLKSVPALNGLFCTQSRHDIYNLTFAHIVFLCNNELLHFFSDKSIQIMGERRAAKLHELCRDHNFAELEHSNNSLYRFFLADDRRKAVWCTIDKVASSTWKNTLVRSHEGEGRADGAIHSINHLAKHGLVYLSRMSVEDAEYRLRNYFRLSLWGIH